MLALLITTSIAFAQTDKAGKKADKPATETKMKKDGTPDMRTKANKEAAKAEKPAAGAKIKKDGTPDMRYKENKDAAKAKK